MKVMMVSPSTKLKGGISSVVKNYQEGMGIFKQNNVSTTYVSTIFSKNKCFQLIFFPLLSLIFFLKLGMTDIVHFHVSSNGSFKRKKFLAQLCVLRKKKYIVHLHGSTFDKFYRESHVGGKEKIRNFFFNASKVIVLGDFWENFFLKEKIKKNDILILNNAVLKQKKYFASNVLELNGDYTVFGFLGEIGERKGIFDLIEAVGLLKNNKSICLKIAGNGQIEKLKETIKEKKLIKCIEYVGWVDEFERKKFLESIDVLILPSYHEGLPMSILEAMSFSKPVIATDVGSISEAVFNKVNGRLVEAGNIPQLVESMNHFLENKHLINDYGINSLSIFEEKFTLDHHIIKLAEIYNKI